MNALAKRYGTWAQLDHALGKAVALTFGPLLSVDGGDEHYQSVASTCFFEIGSIATPTTSLPPITCRADFLNAYLAEEQLRRTNPAEFRDTEATKVKSDKIAEDLQYVSGLLELVNVEPLRMYSLFQILASATWMSFALVVRAAGLDFI